MQDIRIIIFDHDDTLVKTYGNKVAQHTFIAKKYYDIDITEADIQKEWGKPLHTVLQNLYRTQDVERAMQLSKQHHEDYPKTLFDSTLKTLQTLQKKGILLGTVTSTVRFSHAYDLQALEFPRDMFNFIQTQEDTTVHKPNAKVFDPLKVWLKDQGLKPEQALYVGDSLLDYHAASGAGLHFIGVETGLVDADQFREAGASSVPHIGHLLSSKVLFT